MNERRQELLDRFYTEHGPCCAGCDWWRHLNSVVGECRKSAPVDADQRFDVLNLSYASLRVEAGHILTRREHHCGDFKDEFDWSTLPPHYLRHIGREVTP